MENIIETNYLQETNLGMKKGWLKSKIRKFYLAIHDFELYDFVKRLLVNHKEGDKGTWDSQGKNDQSQKPQFDFW